MSLYFKYFKVHLKSELQYKISFILSFISQFFVFFGYYFTVLCLFDNFSNIKGFTLYEVLLTFGIIQTGFSFCETFFRGIDKFDDLIIVAFSNNCGDLSDKITTINVAIVQNTQFLL